MLTIAILMTVFLGISFLYATIGMVFTFMYDQSETLVCLILSIVSAFLIVGTWLLYCSIP